MYRTIIKYVFLLLLLQPLALLAANIRGFGVPYVQNYPKNIYQAGNQTWAETRDEHGVMYFANSDGLLSFDGHNWQLYKMPNNIIVRAVAADGHGKIYAGGFGEIGYWMAGPSGNLKYTSLVKHIPAKYKLNEEVWKIYVDKNRVIFQSFGTIYIYANGKITTVKAPQPYLFLFRAGDDYLVEQLNRGLFKLNGSKLEFIAGSDACKSGVLAVLPFGSGRYLIGTSKNGLFIYDGHTGKLQHQHVYV